MVRVSRAASTQFLLLNSMDRFQTGANYNSLVTIPKANASYTDQTPWNNFTLQRPQALMNSFLKRISVSEIRFPNYIPNVNSYNNTFYLTVSSDGHGYTAFGLTTPVQPTKVTVPIGFYTPTALVAAVNASIVSAIAVSPQFALMAIPASNIPGLAYGNVGAGTGWASYSFIPGLSGAPFVVTWCNAINTYRPYTSTLVVKHLMTNFGARANFFNLTGFSEAASGVNVNFPVVIPNNYLQGDLTETVYSKYFDICSPELHAFSKQRDGTSAQGSASNNVLCRVFIADDISVANYIGSTTYSAIGQSPSVIHRQFTDPKQIEYSVTASVGSVSIQVLDSWGNLVPLPQVVPQAWQTNGYPDFQISLSCSED